jgi:hypothetical protein
MGRQTLACYEGKTEVHFSRVSTAKFDYPATRWTMVHAIGPHPIYRKLISCT